MKLRAEETDSSFFVVESIRHEWSEKKATEQFCVKGL